MKKYKIISTMLKIYQLKLQIESYLYTKDNISKYELDIDINSKP